MKTTALFAALAMGLACRSIFAMDGIAVSIAYRYVNRTNLELAPEVYAIGGSDDVGIVVTFDIKNNTVVKCDTLDRHICFLPTLRSDGKKVAYLRSDARVENGVLAGDAGKAFITVYDFASREKVDVATNVSLRFRPHLDWPHGDYLYYQSANGDGTQTSEICKVNTNPTASDYRQPSKILDYGQDAQLMRWSISLDGRYAVLHWLDDWGIYPHEFPPPNGNFGAVATLPVENPTNRGQVQIGGCNPSISPTGYYVVQYEGSWHTTLKLFHWRHYREPKTLIELQCWNGVHKGFSSREDFPSWPGGENLKVFGGEWPRWACNSDKWVLQKLGIYGAKGAMNAGTQQVIANWVDRQLIVTSNNPALQVADGQFPIDGTIYYGHTAGDLWVKPPFGKEDGFVEDVFGKWIPIGQAPDHFDDCSFQSAASVSMQPVGQRMQRAASMPKLSLSLDSGGKGVMITHRSGGRGAVSVCDIRGRVLQSELREGDTRSNRMQR